MRDRDLRCSRRKFLASAAALTLGPGISPAGSEKNSRSNLGTLPARPDRDGREPLAVVATVYRPLSDAYHLVGRFLHGYDRGGQLHIPKQFAASLYVDQAPDNDLSREIGRDFEVRVTRSIGDALTLGTGQLAVIGVLLIAEHGNYPRNEKGQILYPRFEMLEQITNVFRKSGRSVPVFHAKHLSHDWDKARKMADWSAELNFPLMAGSPLAMTWRRPELELPIGSPIQDSLVAGYGPLEVYGSHALEALQVMVERRRGGESGVRSVTCLTGKDVWKAGDAGLWSWELLGAALGRSETRNLGDLRKNVGTLAVQPMPATPAAAFLVDYLDGTRGAVLLLNGHVQDFCFAAKVADEPKPVSCLFHMPPPPGARAFDCLANAIEKMFTMGRTPFPIERALLTTGTLGAAMESHYRRGSKVETPHLAIHYDPSSENGFERTGPASTISN